MPKSKKSSNKHALPAQSAASIASAFPLGIWAGAVIIALTACIAYFPFLSGGFIWDDDMYLTNNKFIGAADGLYKFWCSTEPIDYYPVSNTTLWIEWRLWGMHPAGYHVTNLILHIIESLLILVILRKLAIPGAFLTAVIFAVHPVNVESVAWIAQRKDMLATLFFLLSILCYLKCLISIHSDDIQLRPTHGVCGVLAGRWYWLSLLAFLIGMLSKGSVTMLPVLLLGIIWWLRPLTMRDVVRTAPFFLVAIALTGVHVWFQTHGIAEVIRSAGFTERLLGAGCVVWFYLYKALLPINLVFVYPQWQINTTNLLWWLPLLATVAVTGVLWWYRNSWSRPFFFAWGFFCVALVPVMGFTDVYFLKYALVADHYQHIAIIGVIALASALWSAWCRQGRGGAHWAAIAAAIAAVGTLAFLTRQLSGQYRDEITLYQATLEKNPACWMAHNNLGSALFDAGRPQEAVEHYEQVLRLKPDHFEAHFNLGVILMQSGRFEEAIEHFRQVLQFNPDDHEAHNNLAIALAQTGRPQEAIEHYRQALRLKPDFTEAYFNLSFAYARIQNYTEAVATARKSLELARSQGRTELAGQIENWLNSYREGR